MSSQAPRAAESEVSAFRKSAGTLWTAPPGILFLAIDSISAIMSHAAAHGEAIDSS